MREIGTGDGKSAFLRHRLGYFDADWLPKRYMAALQRNRSCAAERHSLTRPERLASTFRLWATLHAESQKPPGDLDDPANQGLIGGSVASLTAEAGKDVAMPCA